MTTGHDSPASRPAENTIAGTVLGASLQAHTINGDVVFSPPRTLRPAQLRPASPFFTNRSQELAELNELLGPSPAESGPPGVVVISGVGGCGKTAFALHWAHSVLDRFGDGQFFVDLRGCSGDRSGPLEPRAVLERFLRALGVVHPDYMPSDVEELAALWRTVIAGQRFLIVADNAASADQVRPLLPGSGPATVVVTTRLRLPDLAIDGARPLHLGPLDDASSLTLLGRLIGRARMHADPEAARSLIAHSGRLPLTLAALGAHLSTHSDRSIATLVGAFADQRPDRTENDMNPHATLDLLYEALSRDEQATYRLIGQLPGHDFTAETIAELASVSQDEALRRLGGLTNGKLLERSPTERFRIPDPIRPHAQANAHAIASAADVRAFMTWVAEWYRDTAADAQRAVIPNRWYLADCFHRPIKKTFTRLAALDWLEAEMSNLIAVQQMAYDAELYQIACEITETLWGLFVYRRTYSEWLQSCQIGYQAAVAWGDPKYQARALEGLGAAHQSKQDWLTAEEYFRRALVLEEQADHLQGAATALEGIGVSQLGAGQHDRALATFMRSLGYHLALKRPRGARLQQRHICQVHLAAGRYRDAIEALEEGRLDEHGVGEEYLEGRELLFEGRAHLGMGDLARAEEILNRALSLAQQNDAEQEQATVNVALADLARARGDNDGERHLLQQALVTYARLGLPQASQVDERIQTIRATGQE
ncbi:MAG: tetratricopeptide repeat protein [Actinoallomurus sp.]